LLKIFALRKGRNFHPPTPMNHKFHQGQYIIWHKDSGICSECYHNSALDLDKVINFALSAASRCRSSIFHSNIVFAFPDDWYNSEKLTIGIYFSVTTDRFISYRRQVDNFHTKCAIRFIAH
jgi:hypothetical protein